MITVSYAEIRMSARKRTDAKSKALRQQGVLNSHPDDIRDELFRECEFFDPRDLVQVRYEMLRSVQHDGRSVKDAAARFGCSRPTFYKAQKDFDGEGLAGLTPRKRGPRGGHKLTEEVLDFVERVLGENRQLSGVEVSAQVLARFGVKVHASSIGRAVSRRKKKRR